MRPRKPKDTAPPPEPAADDAPDPIAALVAVQEIGLPWAEMRDKLKDVIVSVANGSVKATAAQVAMLKHIVAEAKEATKGDEGVIGVVILPTQGAAASLQITAAAKKRALEAIRGTA